MNDGIKIDPSLESNPKKEKHGKIRVITITYIGLEQYIL